METKDKKTDFLIRGIPKEFWDEVKHKQIDLNHKSLRELVLAAIKEYIK
jgi:hypothetical protein